MAVKITPRLIDLTYEATLKSYWRKSALRKFLRASHVTENFLTTWAPEESKREFLDRLFIKLQKSDRGKSLIIQIALSLSEQSTFPDLQNWEETDQMISLATEAVQDLKTYLELQNEEIRSEREIEATKKKVRARKAEIQKSLTDRSKLQEQLEAMHPKIGTQEGGYEFQDWFYDLLDYFEITNRRPYNTNGRQIDGSLTYDGTTYLVELKFTDTQLCVTDIDSLRSKVEDKADNTMGIMVSISGYSGVAVDNASGRRGLLLLFDSQHLYMCLSGGLSFGELISRVRRHASQTGEAYLKVTQFSG